MTTEPTPDELITVAYCPGCETITPLGQIANVSEPGSQHKAVCPKCKTRLTAESFYDYVDKRTVNYE